MTIYTSNYGYNVFPVLTVLLIVGLGVLLWRRYRLPYVLCVGIFGVYLLMAIAQVFFPIHMDFVAQGRESGISLWSQVNLIPFYTRETMMPHLIWREMWQNILLTIPFGFGVSFIAPVRPKHIGWWALLVGLMLEGTQLLLTLLLRYPYRVVDINDVMLNALGVLLGYAGFRLFAWIYVQVTERLGITCHMLTAYVYEVAQADGRVQVKRR